MAETMTQPGMPRKVLATAQVLGVHTDCLISEVMCVECHRHVNMAFDHHYGDARNEVELLERIMDDFRLDILDEL